MTSLLYRKFTSHSDRSIFLRDLIPGGKIWVEIVFAIESRLVLDLCAQSECQTDGQLNALRIDDLFT